MPQLQLKEEDIVCLILEYLQKRDLGEFSILSGGIMHPHEFSEQSVDVAICDAILLDVNFLQALVNSR